MEFATPYNVVAAFSAEPRARAAVEQLGHAGVPPDAIRIHHPDEGGEDEEAELRAEMQDELLNSWGAPAFFMTGPQAKGAFLGTALFAAAGVLVGLAIGLVWAYLFDEALSRLARVVIATVLSGTAGGTIGFIAGGGLEPRREAAADRERPMDDRRAVGERDVLVGVHAAERSVIDRATEVLRAAGAERVDLVDAQGTPLPPQHEHPRPADPDDWWWRRAGHG